MLAPARGRGLSGMLRAAGAPLWGGHAALPAATPLTAAGGHRRGERGGPATSPTPPASAIAGCSAAAFRLTSTSAVPGPSSAAPSATAATPAVCCCGVSFKHSMALSHHQNHSGHSKVECCCTCGICGNTFDSQFDLALHRKDTGHAKCGGVLVGGTDNLTRENILIRDRFTCQYCGDELTPRALKISHVVPTSKGGVWAWDNLVAACSRCIRHKNDRPLEWAGMDLVFGEPKAPRFRSWGAGDIL
mmetsp:Transcript_60835/g.193010  ORF Transcript_60835/g.193010 Transcript_60835/m.193010 type:complete len:246 (+) Transcript_60835:48-785(+)